MEVDSMRARRGKAAWLPVRCLKLAASLHAAQRGGDLFHGQLQQQAAKTHAAAVEAGKDVKHLIALAMSDERGKNFAPANRGDARKPAVNLGVVQLRAAVRCPQLTHHPLQLVCTAAAVRADRHQPAHRYQTRVAPTPAPARGDKARCGARGDIEADIEAPPDTLIGLSGRAL